MKLMSLVPSFFSPVQLAVAVVVRVVCESLQVVGVVVAMMTPSVVPRRVEEAVVLLQRHYYYYHMGSTFWPIKKLFINEVIRF